MRTLLACAATVLLALALPVRAQEEPNSLLARYLSEGDAGLKAALRAELLKLSPEKLHELMAALPCPGEGRGELSVSLRCPDGFERSYYLRVPRAYDASRSWPLMVVLHGGVNGASAGAGPAAVSAWLASLSDAQRESLFFLAPSADCESTTIQARWWRDGGMKNIRAMLADVKRRYHIDDDRVFLTGQSDGGSGTWAAAFRRPDDYAGFFPMVGHPLVPATDRTSAYFENLKGCSLYNISGGLDPVYPGSEVSKIVGEINSVGPKVLHKNYEKAGHDLSFADVELPRIFNEYLSAWKRDLLARQLDWSTEQAKFGSRAWLEILETKELDRDYNKCPKATPRGTGVVRIDLGIRVPTPTTPEELDGPITVRHIEPGSVADTMGVKVGDTVIKVDGKKVTGLDEINAALRNKGAGKEISLTVLRDGEEKTLSGKFPPLEKDPPSGRVLGSWSPGQVELKTHNVTRLRVRLAPEMVDAKGEVRIKVNGKEAFKGRPPQDVAMMLDQFEASFDRKWPFTAVVTVDVVESMKGK